MNPLKILILIIIVYTHYPWDKRKRFGLEGFRYKVIAEKMLLTTDYLTYYDDFTICTMTILLGKYDLGDV